MMWHGSESQFEWTTIERLKCARVSPTRDIEKAVRDLVDDTVESEGVVDIFKAAGIMRADISMLDDNVVRASADQSPQLSRPVSSEHAAPPLSLRPSRPPGGRRLRLCLQHAEWPLAA